MSEHSTMLIQDILGNLFHNIDWQAVFLLEWQRASGRAVAA